jgi:hypothetical protein
VEEAASAGRNMLPRVAVCYPKPKPQLR